MPPYPSLSRRAIALFLDLVAVWAVGIAIRSPEILFWGVMPLYFIAFPLSPLEATPGKWIMGMRIAEPDGRPVKAWRPVVRYAVSVVSMALAGLGFVFAAWTRRRQALHDLAAGTVVLQRAAKGADVGEAPRLHLAVRILWTLFVPLFIASLAVMFEFGIARGRYEVVRDLLDEAAPYLAEVDKALAEGRKPPESVGKGGIKSITARPDGSVLLVASDEVLRGARIVFTRRPGEPEHRRWKCTVEGVRVTYLPLQCRN